MIPERQILREPLTTEVKPMSNSQGNIYGQIAGRKCGITRHRSGGASR